MTSARAWWSSSVSRPSGISETSEARICSISLRGIVTSSYSPRNVTAIGAFTRQKPVVDAAAFGHDDVVGVVGLDLEAGVEDVSEQLFLAAIVDARKVGTDPATLAAGQVTLGAVIVEYLAATA